MKRKVFISYHHANDQSYKEELLKLNRIYEVFIDMSVDTGDISEELSDQAIREKIRDEYLKDSTVLIVLIGTETKNRKHIDWEIYSSMYDGKINKKSGILIVNLPTIEKDSTIRASNQNEKNGIFPEIKDWISIKDREKYKERYPYFPDRIIDNFLAENVKISVVNWEHIKDINKLKTLIENAYANKSTNEYDLSRAMKKINS